MLWKRWLLLALSSFVALGALGGGLGLVIDPTGATVGVDPALLHGTPFANYLVPGMLLLLVVGGVQLQAAGFAAVDDPMAGPMGAAAGATLLVWILTQVAMMGIIHPFQAAMFIIAVAQLGLGAAAAWEGVRWGHSRTAAG